MLVHKANNRIPDHVKSNPLDIRAKFQEFKSIILQRGNRGTGIAGQFAFLHSMQ